MRRARSLAALAGTAILVGLGASDAGAANWLLLQGTEPAGSTETFRPWGFLQVEYQHTRGTRLRDGPWRGDRAAFNQVRPGVDRHSRFNAIRARLGARGRLCPLDCRSSYFLLAELGHNGLTDQTASVVRLTDASLTFDHAPGARLRLGLFKYPGSEEGLQGIHVFDWINFTEVTDQLLLERFFEGDGSGTPPGGGPGSREANELHEPVGAFRDLGAQLFGSVRRGAWEHGYALMAGTGTGVATPGGNARATGYAYLSSERIFSGRGPHRQGLKLYAWYQRGLRDLQREGAGSFVRERFGAGLILRRSGVRLGAEYVQASGMIPNGTDGGAAPDFPSPLGGLASVNLLPKDRARGGYVELAYRLPIGLELGMRLARLERATRTDAHHRRFENVTLGAQYGLGKSARLLFNYELRWAEAPGLAAHHPANRILRGLDDRISTQLLFVF